MRDLAISLKEACAMSQTFDWGGTAEGGMLGEWQVRTMGKLLRYNSNKMHARA